MSDDPNSAPAPDASAQSGEKILFRSVKRRYKRDSESEGAPGVGNEPAGIAPEDQLRREIDALNVRLRALAEQRTAPPAPTEAEARNAKYFRLTRKAVAPVPPRDLGAAAPEPAPPVMPPTTRVVVGYHPPENTNWLLISAGALVLAMVAFFLGEASSRPASAATSAPHVIPAWTQPDIARLDRVLDTERGGNLPEAYHDALDLSKQLGGRSELEEYAALLEARQGSSNNAEADLLRKADPAGPPLETAATQKRLGFVFARARDFRSAAEAFSNAAAADPLDPLAFYYWGESLRRSGLLPEAIGKFGEVLLRLPGGQPESSGLFQSAALRRRLSQIELGSDNGMKTEIDLQLNRPVPTVYWLLTAVAYDLQHNDVPAALGVLQRIKVTSPPDLFDALLNDYFLRALAIRNNAVAAYFPEMTPERRGRLDASGAYFIDP